LVYYAHGEREKFSQKTFLSPREKNLRANPLLRVSFRQDAKTGNSVEIFPEQKTKNCFAVLKTCEVLLCGGVFYFFVIRLSGAANDEKSRFIVIMTQGSPCGTTLVCSFSSSLFGV
jgi:hypothetical protein